MHCQGRALRFHRSHRPDAHAAITHRSRDVPLLRHTLQHPLSRCHQKIALSLPLKGRGYDWRVLEQ